MSDEYSNGTSKLQNVEGQYRDTYSNTHAINDMENLTLSVRRFMDHNQDAGGEVYVRLLPRPVQQVYVEGREGSRRPRHWAIVSFKAVMFSSTLE